jgi:hypothetical protein
MNQQETARLLAFVSAYDHRTITAELPNADVEAWWSVLHEQPLQDCKEAVVTFFRTEKGWIMPGDVFRLARRVRAERAREADKQRALTATPAPLTDADIRRRIRNTPEFKAAFDAARLEGNISREFETVLRQTGDRRSAVTAAQAFREAARAARKAAQQ